MQSLITAGVATAIIGGMITLVRMAVSGDRRRADDWREAAQTQAEANKVLSTNLDKLINTVEQMANSQRDMMGLLQRIADRIPS